MHFCLLHRWSHPLRFHCWALTPEVILYVFFHTIDLPSSPYLFFLIIFYIVAVHLYTKSQSQKSYLRLIWSLRNREHIRGTLIAGTFNCGIFNYSLQWIKKCPTAWCFRTTSRGHQYSIRLLSLVSGFLLRCSAMYLLSTNYFFINKWTFSISLESRNTSIKEKNKLSRNTS